jgi:7-cyano-7-deazaguanine synthase
MNVVLILSGGLDSSVLLAYLLHEGHTVHALSLDYGQRHRKELASAVILAQHYGVEHRIADLSALRPLLGGSSQTDPSVPVPHGHYAEVSMKRTVVPNRNMLLLAVAGAWAISLKADAIAYGAHSGDHAIYPDCRAEFAAAMGHSLSLADWHPVTLISPFVDRTKADIAKLGHELGVPLEKTWSCYEGGTIHCGLCGTCVERREAFELAGVPDPTEYGATADVGISHGPPSMFALNLTVPSE